MMDAMISNSIINLLTRQMKITRRQLSLMFGKSNSYFNHHNVGGGHVKGKSVNAFLEALAEGKSVPQPMNDVSIDALMKLLKINGVSKSRFSNAIGRTPAFISRKETVDFNSGEVILACDFFGFTPEKFKTVLDEAQAVTATPIELIFDQADETDEKELEQEEKHEEDQEDELVDEPRTELTARLSARFTDEEWAYLTEKHWQWRLSFTDIIRKLVREDMEKHPEIMECINKN